MVKNSDVPGAGPSAAPGEPGRGAAHHGVQYDQALANPMTGITAAIPYGFSALAQIKWRRADRKAGQTARFVRDMIVAVLVLVFSILFIWYSRYTGQSPWVYWAPFLLAGAALLLGIPVYRSQRHNLTEPEPVPPYPQDTRTASSTP